MRTLLSALAAILSVGLAGLGAALPAAAADDGNLQMDGDVTYELRPDEARVRVTVEMRLSNLIADDVRSDGSTFYTVYESVSVAVPAEAVDVTARRVGGGTLSTFRSDMDDPRWTVLGVNLSPDLRFGSPQTLEISYDLPDQPPRSEGLVRAGPAYTLFPIYSMGDPEHASVTVVVPDVFEQLEVVGGDMGRSVSDDGVVTYTADTFGEEFYATLAARNDDLLDERQITSGEHEFTLRYTPGDEEWADFAEDVVSRGVTLLEQAIGEPWPADGDMAIVESSSPHAFGYGGWFDLEANTIEVSDHLDAGTMLHELAHAWFNHDTMGDRWLREGLSDLYADLVAHRMAGWEPQREPGPSDSGESIVLAEWDESAVGLRGIDEFGYDTSWWVMDQLHDELGGDTMTDVLGAAFDKQMPYAPADGEREELRGPVDWRRMLDLLEEVGGSDLARELYAEHVLGDDGVEQLEQRDEARETYHQLARRAAGWGAPFELRRAMSTWTYPRVNELVSESEQVLGYRDDVLAALSGLGVDALPELEAEYRSGERLDDVIELGRRYTDTVEVIETAQERPDGAVGALTSLGTTIVPTEYVVTDAAALVRRGELDQARSVSETITEEVEQAPLFGGIVLGQALLCMLTVPFVVRSRLRRRRHEPTAPDPQPAEAASVPAA